MDKNSKKYFALVTSFEDGAAAKIVPAGELFELKPKSVAVKFRPKNEEDFSKNVEYGRKSIIEGQEKLVRHVIFAVSENIGNLRELHSSSSKRFVPPKRQSLSPIVEPIENYNFPDKLKEMRAKKKHQKGTGESSRKSEGEEILEKFEKKKKKKHHHKSRGRGRTSSMDSKDSKDSKNKVHDDQSDDSDGDQFDYGNGESTATEEKYGTKRSKKDTGFSKKLKLSPWKEEKLPIVTPSPPKEVSGAVRVENHSENGHGNDFKVQVKFDSLLLGPVSKLSSSAERLSSAFTASPKVETSPKICNDGKLPEKQGDVSCRNGSTLCEVSPQSITMGNEMCDIMQNILLEMRGIRAVVAAELPVIKTCMHDLKTSLEAVDWMKIAGTTKELMLTKDAKPKTDQSTLCTLSTLSNLIRGDSEVISEKQVKIDDNIYVNKSELFLIQRKNNYLTPRIEQLCNLVCGGHPENFSLTGWGRGGKALNPITTTVIHSLTTILESMSWSYSPNLSYNTVKERMIKYLSDARKENSNVQKDIEKKLESARNKKPAKNRDLPHPSVEKLSTAEDGKNMEALSLLTDGDEPTTSKESQAAKEDSEDDDSDDNSDEENQLNSSIHLSEEQ